MLGIQINTGFSCFSFSNKQQGKVFYTFKSHVFTFYGETAGDTKFEFNILYTHSEHPVGVEMNLNVLQEYAHLPFPQVISGEKEKGNIQTKHSFGYKDWNLIPNLTFHSILPFSNAT